MSKQDIADLRRWHRNAVVRSMKAGYDVVYVYAGHAFGGIEHFLSPRFNQRTDEYGGSAAQPDAAAARGPRGHPGGRRRPRRRCVPDQRRGGTRATRACAALTSRRSSASSASCPTCGTS